MRSTREIVTTPPAISLDTFKNHVRVVGNAFDKDLALKLRAAILAAEAEIDQILALSNYTLTGQFTSLVDLSHLYPLVEVKEVVVDDTVLDSDLYTLNDSVLSFSQTVDGNKMKIIAVAGYESLPEDIISAILLIAADYWYNPTDSVKQLPTASGNILKYHRKWPATK